MSTKILGWTLLLLIAVAVAPGWSGASDKEGTAVPHRGAVPPSAGRRTETSSGASLLFVENAGQFDARARFQVRGAPGTLWLTEQALWLTLVEHPRAEAIARGGRLRAEPRQAVNLRLRFINANPSTGPGRAQPGRSAQRPQPRLEPFDRQDTAIHYYRGDGPSQWHTDVPAWGGVRYRDLYPGVDLEISGKGGRWTWRFLVRDPQFDLADVRLQVAGSPDVSVRNGALHLNTGVGEVTLPLPSIAEATATGGPAAIRTADQTFEIAAPFALATPDDAASPRATYPEAAYFGSYLGGAGNDLVYDVAVAGTGDILDRGTDSGSVWMVGATASTDFPTAPGDTFLSGTSDAFVTKMKRGAVYVAPAFSAYVGGANGEAARGVVTDADGNVYVTGWTESNDFATTASAFDRTHNGCVDAFVVKLDGDGTLLYGSYLGGSHVTIPGLGDECGDDEGAAIALSAADVVYLTGRTRSQDFPTTSGAYDTELSNPSIGLNDDTFLVKLDLSKGTSGLLYGTFVGGGTPSAGQDIALDGSGNAYVAGNSQAAPDGVNHFPTTPGAYDRVSNETYILGSEAFFFKLNPGGNGTADLLYSTFLGVDWQEEYAYGIALDAANQVYVCGETNAPDFPTTPGALDATCGTDGNCNEYYNDAFVSKLDPAGNGAADLLYATFLGGDTSEIYLGGGCDIALDAQGDVYVTGDTTSKTGFPITPDAYAQTINDSAATFVARLRLQGNGADDLVYGTYVNGINHDGGTAIALDQQGRVYVGGITGGYFPVTDHALYKTYGGGSRDGFLFRLLAPPAPDLSTSTKSVAPDEAGVGQVVTFTVRMVNSGVISATASFTDTLPPSLLLQGSPSASSGGAPAVDGQTLTWTGVVTHATDVNVTYAALLTSTTTITPTAVNEAYVDDGRGNVYVRRAFVNGYGLFLPLVLR